MALDEFWAREARRLLLIRSSQLSPRYRRTSRLDVGERQARPQRTAAWLRPRFRRKSFRLFQAGCRSGGDASDAAPSYHKIPTTPTLLASQSPQTSKHEMYGPEPMSTSTEEIRKSGRILIRAPTRRYPRAELPKRTGPRSEMAS